MRKGDMLLTIVDILVYRMTAFSEGLKYYLLFKLRGLPYKWIRTLLAVNVR